MKKVYNNIFEVEIAIETFYLANFLMIEQSIGKISQFTLVIYIAFNPAKNTLLIFLFFLIFLGNNRY